jgi:hypothetical protein
VISSPSSPDGFAAAALDELIAWAASDGHAQQLAFARAEMKAHIGEVFEDDRQVELRMTSFLEWFVCDRIGMDGCTPAQARYRQALKSESQRAAARFSALCDTVYEVFEVVAVSHQAFRFRALVAGAEYAIAERRALTGIEVGAIAEARLVKLPDGDYALTPAIYWHPTEAGPLIRAEAARRGSTLSFQANAFVFACAARALKAERYRQIAIERLYDFDNPKL